MKKQFFVLTLMLTSLGLNAQEKSLVEANNFSNKVVDEGAVLKKLTIWRRVDLREKKNQPMFSLNAEITKHLMEGVRAGILDAYTSDSCTKKLTKDQFDKALSYTTGSGGLSTEEKEAGFGQEAAKPSTETVDDGWGGTTSAPKQDDGWGAVSTPGVADAGGLIPFLPTQLYLLEIKENWVFDKQRSRQFFDIQTLKILIPSEYSPEGTEKEVAVFKYKDLDRFFRNNPSCIWYNTENVAQHKNLADAFELRLFQGRIVKNSNPKNEYLEQMYKSQREGLLQSQRLEQELMEFEHNLWEY